MIQLNQLIHNITLGTAILSYIACMFHEMVCVLVVKYSEHDNAFMNAVVTMLAGECTIICWVAIMDNIFYGPFMILGWATGSYLGVKLKKYL